MSSLIQNVKNVSSDMIPVWRGIILNLVKEVVQSVDPDMRRGDSIDIRDYVKIKIIPGRHFCMQNCTLFYLQHHVLPQVDVLRRRLMWMELSSARTFRIRR